MSSITYTLDLGDLGEQDFDISYTYTAGSPGVLSGPPEKCYPPEASEFEILDIRFNGQRVSGPLEELITNFLYDNEELHEAIDETEAERAAEGRPRDE